MSWEFSIDPKKEECFPQLSVDDLGLIVMSLESRVVNQGSPEEEEDTYLMNFNAAEQLPNIEEDELLRTVLQRLLTGEGDLSGFPKQEIRKKLAIFAGSKLLKHSKVATNYAGINLGLLDNPNSPPISSQELSKGARFISNTDNVVPAFNHPEASCQKKGNKAFFPKGSTSIQALKLCFGEGGCPAIDHCLRYALENHSQGIWGGTNQEQRNDITKVYKTKGRGDALSLIKSQRHKAVNSVNRNQYSQRTAEALDPNIQISETVIFNNLNIQED